MFGEADLGMGVEVPEDGGEFRHEGRDLGNDWHGGSSISGVLIASR